MTPIPFSNFGYLKPPGYENQENCKNFKINSVTNTSAGIKNYISLTVSFSSFS